MQENTFATLTGLSFLLRVCGLIERPPGYVYSKSSE